MSGSEDNKQEPQQGPRRKSRPRACDQCRKRKLRCNGLGEEGKTCSTCVSFKDTCTYTSSNEARKLRQVDADYLKALQSEVTRLRLLVQQLQAQLHEKERLSSSRTPPAHMIMPPVPERSTPSIDRLVPREDLDYNALEGFASMSLKDKQYVRFLGQTSHFSLVKAALRIRQEIAEESDGLPRSQPIIFYGQRPDIWLYPFDIVPDPPYTHFPDPALMSELLDNYFRTIHLSLPVLHRPTFMQGVASKLHLVDETFGALVLLVCALGARFSHDLATLPPGAAHWQLSGWPWFEQVRDRWKLMSLKSATLQDVQVAVLFAAYIATLGLPHTTCVAVGYAVRLCFNLGLHRRTTYSTEPSLDNELRKRAFWCLIPMDRLMTTMLGWPCSIHDEEFDLDYPLECDDEYLSSDDPCKAFKQPPGKPSAMAYFVWYLRLMKVHDRAVRTIFSSEDTRKHQDPVRAQQLAFDLDSELSAWYSALPEHLKYDRDRGSEYEGPFAAQAVSLNAAYHNLRLFIHRPLIMTAHGVPSPSPSLTICMNAARSCIEATDRYFALCGPLLVYQNHLGFLLTSSIILILQIGRNIVCSGTSVHAAEEIEYVDKALRLLGSLEPHWRVAAFFGDVIRDLMPVLQSDQQENSDGPPHDPSLPPEAEALSSDTLSTHTEDIAETVAPSCSLADPYLNVAAPTLGPPSTNSNTSSTGWEGSHSPPLSSSTSNTEVETDSTELLPTLEYHPQGAVRVSHSTTSDVLHCDEAGMSAATQQVYAAAYPQWWGIGVAGAQS